MRREAKAEEHEEDGGVFVRDFLGDCMLEFGGRHLHVVWNRLLASQVVKHEGPNVKHRNMVLCRFIAYAAR